MSSSRHHEPRSGPAPGPVSFASYYSTSCETNSSPFSRATVCWKTHQRTSKPRDVWLSITSFVRWMYVDSQDNAPENLSAFRGHECLALERLAGNAHWKDVVTAVYPLRTENGHGVVVPGNMSGQRSPSVRKKKLHFILVANSENERDPWMQSIRIRISPWQLLHRRMKEMFIDSSLSQEALRAMFLCVESRSSAEGLPDLPNDTSRVDDAVERVESAMEAVNVLPVFAEAVATAVKKSAPLVKDRAEHVADLAKCVSVVSSAFQVVALCASLAEMGLEMKRGYKEWPRILSFVEELRSATVESMVPLLHPDGFVKEMLLKNVFQVQEELVNVLAKVEKEVMRIGVIQLIFRFFKSTELKETEETVAKMKNSVLAVVQSAEIAKNSVALENVRKLIVQEHTKNASSLRLRPRLTPYSVGREKELCNIKDILDQHGSAAIMNYGGVGKTQLMVAFAERSEKRGWVPGGCYWIRGHGNIAQFVESLANFTESLMADLLSEKDRRDLGVVLGTLKKKLNSFTQMWILCVDNADSNEVNEVLGELCSLTEGCSSIGWVIVTSRQGGRTLWDGMVSEQKLKLKPLKVYPAMTVLFRWKAELLNVAVSDNVIMQKLKDLKRDEPLEYQWLRKLAGDDKVCGLAGLPLAVAQAGSFIHRHGFSFSKYASEYGKKRQCKDVLRLFPEVKDRGLEESHQRMIWATWKVNLDALSETARRVLFAVALFDCVCVPEELLKGLDSSFESDEVAYTKIVRGELVDGASFLQENNVEGHVTFEMHRLLRGFILLEVNSDNDCCYEALHRAVRIAHKGLKSTGKSLRCGEFRRLLPHLTSLLIFVSDDQFSLGASIPKPFVFF